MSEPTYAANSGITRRTILTGFGIGAIAGFPIEAPRAAIVNLVALGKDGWLFPVWDDVRHADIQKIRGMARFVSDAVGVIKHANIEMAISITPSKARVYREFLPDDFKFSADTDHRYAVAIEEYRRPGTLVPDLATNFANVRRAQPIEALFLKADTHWTAAGAEATAAEFAKEIKEKLRLSPSAMPGIQLGQPVSVLQEKNDLAELLPVADRAKYPLQTYLIHKPVEAEEQGALVADDTADVVVIGNSYMQPKYNFPAMLSNQLNRPVSLVWKVHQYGPYRTLLIYLASESFKRQRPKLIIWNFEETDLENLPDRRDAWGQNAMPPQGFMAELHRVLGA
jgi:alginate O-acetyltransferase complex protein AlgJ